MNIQFAAQFLLQEEDRFSSLERHLLDLGCDEEACKYIMTAVRQELLTPFEAIEIVRKTVPGIDEMSTVGGGSTAGASFTPGAGEQMATTKAFKKKKYTENSEEEALQIGDRVKVIYGNQFYGHTGTIEDIVRGFVVVDVDDQGTYSMHASDVIKIDDEEDLDEDAPRLAGNPSKTSSQGAKNISAYTSVGFTKAPNAEQAGKKMKGIDVDMLWKEALDESRAYSKFKKEAAMRSKPDQLHQAAKMIQYKLDEVTKLLEFTSQMRQDLSEGETTVEYKHNTKKVFERIHSKVVEVYTKVKGLK